MSGLIERIIRRREKYTSTPSQKPTLPEVGTNHVDDNWLDTDIYPGELYINTFDGKIYTSDGSQIIELNHEDSLIDGLVVTGTTNPLRLAVSSGLAYINSKIYEHITLNEDIIISANNGAYDRFDCIYAYADTANKTVNDNYKILFDVVEGTNTTLVPTLPAHDDTKILLAILLVTASHDETSTRILAPLSYALGNNSIYPLSKVTPESLKYDVSQNVNLWSGNHLYFKDQIVYSGGIIGRVLKHYVSSTVDIETDIAAAKVVSLGGSGSGGGGASGIGYAVVGGNPGSVLFVTSDETLGQYANFVWNDITNRLGIGTDVPKATLHSTGTTILGVGTSALVDSDLGNGQVNIWVNETNNSLNFKTKKSDGTVINKLLGYFNGNRAIKRAPAVGITPGGETLEDFFNNLLYPLLPATVSIGSHSLQETGTTYTPTITGTITLNDETTISNQQVINVTAGNTVAATPGSNSISSAVSSITANNTYKITADAANDGTPTTISSSNMTISFVYPFLYGMSSSAALYSSGGTSDIYSAFAGSGKLIQSSGNKTVTLNGTTQYIYFCYPSSYGALVSIIDQNGFNVTSSFQTTTLTLLSTGITPGWGSGVTYRIYRTTTVTTVSSAAFQFKFS